MDPLSFAASLSALATVTFQLVSYIGTIREGGEERKKLGTQLTTLWMVLQQLQAQFAADLTSGDQSWASKLQILQEPGGVLSRIGDALSVLQAKLQSKSGGKKILQSLLWPLDKADVDRAIQQIYQLHQLLTGVLNQANIALSQEIRKNGVEVRDVIDGEELKSFLDWISPLNFVQRQQLIFNETRAGTGKWFLNDESYQKWENSSGGVLWCPGIPGAGKSFLSSIVVNKLQLLQKSQMDKKVAVLMIYFAFDDANSQSPNLILGSLLKQLIQHRSEVPQELRADFRRHRNDGTRPSPGEIVKALQAALARFDNIYIVMDALDELLEEGKRKEIIEFVKSLNDKVNLLVTSRPIESIRKLFSSQTIYCDGCEDVSHLPSSDSVNPQEAPDSRQDGYFYHCMDCDDDLSFDLCQACYDKGVVSVDPTHEGHQFAKAYRSLSIEILARDEDLQSYTEWRIDGHESLKRCVNKKAGLRDQILQRVTESAQGMFLLARFHMDSLVTKLTPKAVIKALETLPTETDTTYEKAMQRINDMNPDFREKAKLFLIWVAYTNRPLNVREIEHATTILPEDTEIDTDEIIPAKILASMCAGLVIIDEMENVRLCHYTVENYFMKHKVAVFQDADVYLARTCLTYLLLDDFEVGQCADRDFDSRSKQYPLLGYAAMNWGRHAIDAEEKNIEEQVLVFLKSDGHRETATQAFWYLDTDEENSWDAKSGATGLHLATYFGLFQAVERLIDDHIDVNALDSLNTTSLMYASEKGHESVVDKLLKAGAKVNLVCSRGGNALHRAVVFDHLSIVKLILARKETDVNVYHSGWGHLSALMLASESGQADIIKELLTRPDIMINDLSGAFSALHIAVRYEQLEAVKILLADPRIDVDLRNQDGWAALIMAARYGYVAIAEALLDKGANIEQSDSELDGGGTAILRAIDYNKFAMVQLLYKRGAVWDCKDKYNRSLIHGAAVNSRAQILRWLLETQPGFDVNLQDINGKTPLHDAAVMTSVDCITILLEFHARTDIRDYTGKTPLRLAKEHNRLENYELLRKARDEEIKSLNRSGTLVEVIEMTLWTAALTGDQEIVQKYITKAKKNPADNILDATDDGLERCALAAAVEGGQIEIGNMLIAAGVNINLQDRLGRAPLHTSAIYNQPLMAKLLLAAHAEVDILDQWGKTPLSIAFVYDFRALTLLLFEYGAAINPKEQNLNTIMFRAAYAGNDVALSRTLKMGADSQRKDADGLTPLQLARLGKHEKTVKLLEEWQAKRT